MVLLQHRYALPPPAIAAEATASAPLRAISASAREAVNAGSINTRISVPAAAAPVASSQRECRRARHECVAQK